MDRMTRWRKSMVGLFATMLLTGGMGTVAQGAIIDPEYSRPLLDPALQPKFVNSIPNPLIPVFILTPDTTNPAYDYYEVSARQIVQQTGLVSETTGLPLSTTFWGYGDSRVGATTGFHSYPGPTFEVRSNQETRVRWLNELPTTSLLPVDTTIGCGTPGIPCPPVRIVTHVHGAHVTGDSDGGPLPWFSPNFAQVSPFWDPNPYGAPGTYKYPNTQEAGTIWYHDHAMGTTHTNVWAGLAGFHLIRDANEDALQAAGTLPMYPYEVPIAIQDRNFYTDGALAVPDAPVRNLLSASCVTDPVTGLIDPLTCPVVTDPVTGQPIPSITPELFGNMNLANGLIWPKLDVEPRVYRFRLLNGCDSRTYILQFNDPGLTFYQIGTDQAFLAAPVPLSQIILMPGERVDVLVDFKAATLAQVILQNVGPDAPFMGLPVDPLAIADPATTGQVMAFNVNLPLSATPDTADPATIASLRSTPIPTLTPTAPARKLALMEGTDIYGRLMLTLNGIEFMAYPTELPILNDTEVWEIANTTPDVHPMHLHLVQFRVLDRQDFDPLSFVAPVPATATTPFVPPSWTLVGTPVAPPAQEIGFKDTIQMYPNTVTRIIATFDIAGNYVWHCHILSHEEHDMMRPLIVVTPATAVAITANPPVEAPGSMASVIFTAEGSTNLQSLRSADAFEYQFLVNNVVVQAYSPFRNYTWTPTAPGTYTIRAEARAYGSTAPFEAFQEITYSTGVNLFGTVFDASTGLPVAGATVTVNPGAVTTTTDAAGSYSFVLALGTYTVTATKAGYGTATSSATLTAGAATQVDLFIAPTAVDGVIAGIVTDSATGSPVAGVVVTTTPGGFTGVTNSAGEFAIVVPAGNYTLTTSKLGYTSVTTATIAVVAGQTTSPVAIQITAAANGTITGTVTNAATGAAIAGASITVTPGNFTGTTDAAGNYSIMVPAGTYTVEASALGFATGTGTATVAAGGAAIVNITLTAAVDSTLTGNVVDSTTGLPVAGVTVTTIPGGFSAVTDASGNFSIAVPAGTYTVSTSKTGYASTTTDTPVTVAAGATASFGTIAITPAADGSITGTVTDAGTGLPVAGVTITADPGGYTTVTDAAGLYTIAVPPGTYSITATKTGFPTVTETAVVGPGETVTVNLTLEAAAVNPGNGNGSSSSSGWCFISSLGFGSDEGESSAPMALGFMVMVFAFAMALRARERKI